MKKIAILVLAFLMAPVFTLSAQQFVANYDEAKVPAYKLPDPLVFNDGSKVQNKKQWDKRRTEIFKIFENEVYGVAPEWDGELITSELLSDMNALNDKAIRKEIKITLKRGNKELTMLMLLYLPKSSDPVPVFLGYNFGGNHTVTGEPGISITTSWVRNNTEAKIADNKAGESGRGRDASSWQVNEIISRGYGLATIYYGDVDPDFDDGFKNGVHGLYDSEPDETSWGSIAAWAWGLSRALDYLEKVPQIDAGKVILMGHSRLGKAALWAGATDKRFSVVISNNSGCGGASLSKRVFGETVGSINRSFPHWFCENFNKYNEKEELLPVDQHQLLAMIAPRPLYVASAEEDQWADPKGEFLSCVAASPVYKLLTGKAFPATQMPEVNSPVVSTIGYHIRTGGHAVTLYDWQQYLDFADFHLRKKISTIGS
jgi:hypothetical protein